MSETTLDEKLRENILDFTHYHRTCQECGKNWWGLHCPHDGYQSPCPNCDKKPTPVNPELCDCEFVGTVEEIKQAFIDAGWLPPGTYNDPNFKPKALQPELNKLFEDMQRVRLLKKLLM